MQITVYKNFSKKRNSTAVPSSAGQNVVVVLKEFESLHTPTFKILRSNVTNPEQISYVQALGRYYFVDDIKIITNDIVQIICRLDCLATYKSNILASSQLVMRSSSEYNTDITDEMNSPTLELIINKWHKMLEFFSSPPNGGCYILTVAGAQATSQGVYASGASNSYALTAAQMADFVNEFYSTSFLTNLKNEFTNPLSSIISCKYIPVDISHITGVTAIISCGSYGMTSGIGKLITERSITAQYRILPDDLFLRQKQIMPNDFAEPNYLWRDPYTTAMIYLPFVGEVKFPLEIVYKNTPYITIYLDVITGDIMYTLDSSGISAADIIETFTGNCASDCPFGQDQTNWKNVIATTAQFIGMAAGNYAMSSVGQYGAQIAKAAYLGNTWTRAVTGYIGALEFSAQTNGAISSSLSALASIYLTITTITKVPAMSIYQMSDLYGRPLKYSRTLSGLTGYCQCNGAVISLPADYESRKEIEYFLDTGFYIE